MGASGARVGICSLVLVPLWATMARRYRCKQIVWFDLMGIEWQIECVACRCVRHGISARSAGGSVRSGFTDGWEGVL